MSESATNVSECWTCKCKKPVDGEKLVDGSGLMKVYCARCKKFIRYVAADSD